MESHAYVSRSRRNKQSLLFQAEELRSGRKLAEAIEAVNPVTLTYATSDGTATTADGDYVSKTGTLSFTGTKNETNTTPITINGDLKVEPDETFNVVISNNCWITPVTLPFILWNVEVVARVNIASKPSLQHYESVALGAQTL